MAERLDYPSMLARQAAVSRATFGPGERREGILQHIQKEIEEFRAEGDISEAADIVILAHDLLLRRLAAKMPNSNFDAVAIAAATAVRSKMNINEQRVWPDWRGYDQDTAIEHVRSEGE